MRSCRRLRLQPADTTAIHYFGKKPGESCFDPAFVLAAVLEWAGIAKNGWGYIQLF